MQRFRIHAGAVLTPLLLAGCASFPTLPTLPSFLGGGASNELALFGGAITAVGPEGYCPARGVSKPTEGFAVLAPCNFVARGGATPDIVGLITIQAGPAGSASVAGAEEALSALLQDPQGATLLAGEVGTVEAGENIVQVRFTDSAASAVPGTQRDGWRGFFDLEDRLVTCTVRGTSAAPISAAEGKALLAQALLALQGENR